ncbi:malonyl-CoA synthase [Verrucomicrobia bacterium SCGC AG-212-E04]|nr:malonyl-CoA synthase [Verrucomicrobia bacterium SCGC AG-212-E04]
MNENFFALLESHFPANRDLLCIESVDGVNYTWNDLERGTAQIANLLEAFQLPPGSRVAAQVEKSPEALLLYLATLRAGYVFLPLNTAYREVEAAYFFDNAGPALIVCDPENLSWVSRVAAETCRAIVLTLSADGGSGTLIDEAQRQPVEFQTVPRAAEDLAAILYTSGTTGRSKGAILSHRNLSSNALTLHDYWGWSYNDTLIHALPIFHVHGLFVAAHGALLSGGRMIWLPKFDAQEVVRLLPHSTVFMGVPTMYSRLLAEPGLCEEICVNVRLFISGSAPLSFDTFREFQERTGHTILERYGMTETNMLASNPYDPHEGGRLGGTVGKALPGVSIRVVDDRGNLCAPGEIGGIEVKGPNVCLGYWRAPEKTREDFTADGWFKTGDVGRFGGMTAGVKAPPNYLTIVGRNKDLIITGGFNVYPKEIEGFIDALPGVAESAVFGVPHADFGEAVAAAVVPRPGAVLVEAQMIKLLKQQIANFKVPKRIHIVTELPRNVMGKVQKNVLKQTYPD